MTCKLRVAIHLCLIRITGCGCSPLQCVFVAGSVSTCYQRVDSCREPLLDLAWAKLQLDTRRNALESSALTPGRTVALEQIAGLRMA